MQLIICYTYNGTKQNMANMNKDTRDKLYPDLVEKYGEACVMCHIEPWMLIEQGRSPILCIDHINNNNRDNRIENMQILCKSCNTKKNHPSLAEPFKRTATPEMIKGKRDEDNFRRWVAGHFMENENQGLRYDYLIYAGSETVGNSPESCKRYLSKMTSAAGMYEWFESSQGTVLVLKQEYKN